MTVHHVVRQTQGNAQLAHLVLEQVAQRFQQLEVERLGQAAHVVVRFDGLGLARLRAGGFDHVRVDGALGQPASVFDFAGFALEYFDKLLADDLALGFRVGHAGQFAHEVLRGVHVNDVDAQMTGKGFHHLFGLAQAQQAMVHEHTGELFADGLVQQRRGHGRIHAARQAEDDVLVTHLPADGLHLLLDEAGHGPVAAAAGQIPHEAAQDVRAPFGVGDFRVELHGVEATFLVGHAGNGAAVGGGHQFEAFRQAGDLVAVAHPHVQQAVAFVVLAVLNAVEQPGVTPGADGGRAKLAVVTALHLPAEMARHGLHAVADAQHRHTQLEHHGRHRNGVGIVGGQVTAGEDDAPGAEVADERGRNITRMNFAVDVLFTDAAGDELGDLRAVVQDEDFLVIHRGEEKDQRTALLTGRRETETGESKRDWPETAPSGGASG